MCTGVSRRLSLYRDTYVYHVSTGCIDIALCDHVSANVYICIAIHIGAIHRPDTTYSIYVNTYCTYRCVARGQGTGNDTGGTSALTSM